MINLSKNFYGNQKLLDNLYNNFINNSLSNSIILTGPKGIGKTTLAFCLIDKIFKNYKLNINNNNLIYKNYHPNLKYITKELSDKNNKIKNNITINQIRALDNFLNQSSLNQLPKFILIDSADELNINSSNALLKSLEEPNKNTFFILISHQIFNLLPTIRSRCVKFSIDSPTYKDFTKIIKSQNNEINLKNNFFLYDLSNHSPGLALEIYSENIKFVYNNIIHIFSARDLHSDKLINLSNQIVKFTNDEFKLFLILLKFVCIYIIKINLGINNNEQDISNEYSDLFNLAKITPNSITLEILDYISTNEKDFFTYNLDKKIFFLNIFIPVFK